MTRFNQHVRLGRLAAAALLACLATALLAASATAEPTSNENARAAALQKDVDALVAAGVPGAILFVRDGDHTVRLTRRARRHRQEDADERPQPLQDRQPDQELHRDRRAPARRRRQAPPHRQRRAVAARPRPERRAHHASPAAEPRERDRGLRVRSPLPQAVPERKPRLLLGAAPARENGRLASSRCSRPASPGTPPTRTRTTSCSASSSRRPRTTRSARSCEAASSGPCIWTPAATRRRSPACRAPTRTGTWLSASRR